MGESFQVPAPAGCAFPRLLARIFPFLGAAFRVRGKLKLLFPPLPSCPFLSFPSRLQCSSCLPPCGCHKLWYTACTRITYLPVTSLRDSLYLPTLHTYLVLEVQKEVNPAPVALRFSLNAACPLNLPSSQLVIPIVDTDILLPSTSAHTILLRPSWNSVLLLELTIRPSPRRNFAHFPQTRHVTTPKRHGTHETPTASTSR